MSFQVLFLAFMFVWFLQGRGWKHHIPDFFGAFNVGTLLDGYIKDILI